MLKRLLIGGAVLAVVLAVFYVVSLKSFALDIPAMQEEIASGIEEQTDLVGVTVDCPDSIDWEAGSEFHCFAEDVKGQSFRVTVSMENDDGEWSWQAG